MNRCMGLRIWSGKEVTNKVQHDLIYDLGMHTGLDTKYYLDKGFRVVALEANPKLVDQVRQKFADAIVAEKLHIVERALWSGAEPEVMFYVNDKKDDWSSVIKRNANRGATGVQEIRTKTVHLKELFDEYGLPYYLKCDLEGADEVFVDQLLDTRQMPLYVSVEASGNQGLSCLAKMYALGYDRMQIVNQAFNTFTPAPNPPLEGDYVDVRFNGHMSGLFGRELATQRWLHFHDAISHFSDFIRMKQRDPSLAHGWTDIHFSTSDTLKMSSS